MGKNYYSMYDKGKPAVEKEHTIEQEPVAQEDKPTTAKKAQVIDCGCLNIRAMPDIRAKILSVVNAGTEIMVDKNGSNEIWCSVKLPNGQEGHAMRKFLKIL